MNTKRGIAGSLLLSAVVIVCAALALADCRPQPERAKLRVGTYNIRLSAADKLKNGGYTWEDFGARIDYIYVSPDVTVLDYATVADPRPGRKLYPSDHFPVVATVEL